MLAREAYAAVLALFVRARVCVDSMYSRSCLDEPHMRGSHIPISDGKTPPGSRGLRRPLELVTGARVSAGLRAAKARSARVEGGVMPCQARRQKLRLNVEAGT